MAKLKLEYLWLDGYTPVAGLRGKTKVVDGDPDSFTLEDCPMWGFDGSSTQQAEGKNSDCGLKPVALYPDSTKRNAFIVMSEVMNPDGTPHPSNARATIEDDPDTWFGFEQEYFLYQDGRPLGFPETGYPEPQGEYYTGVGFKNIGDLARTIVDEHLDLCIDAGINHEGINAEVAKGQWEFQIFGKGSSTAADQMWAARYLLLRLCEKYGVDVEWHCKPLKGDWNGSGMHCNFSTRHMRDVGGKEYFEKLMEAFNKYRDEHIAVYGPDNHLRLTGLHETQSIDKFNYGLADRGASVRVPHSFINDGYKGYLEDRRPNSQGDPYQIASRIIRTINTVSVS
ncbi:MAG: glutamine synthetase [Verrucomicrobia bacterium]|nr:MAG: glutamine synthetase [Verrucomicrobiota bacterium]